MRKRPMAAGERFFTHSPYSVVALVVRIKGHVTESQLRVAASKLQQRHTNLHSRIVLDDVHVPWLISEGAGEIPVSAVERSSENDWMQVYHEQCKIPFAFEKVPALRLVLLHSPDISEVLIFCHHIICDGLSLAYLARDLMGYLGDPALPVESLPAPTPIELENMPADALMGSFLRGVVKFFINRINKKWEKEAVFFGQEDYEALNEAYWSHNRHQMLSVELSEDETTKLVERCRAEQVTVNSAIAAAFLGAQASVLRGQPYDPSIGVAADLRERLPKPPGEAMGFFAGVVTPSFRYHESKDFWENARAFHKKTTPLFNNRDLFKDPQQWCYLDPAILESRHFKILGDLIPSEHPSAQRIAAFSQRADVVKKLLSRQKMDSLEKTVLGTAVTNLGRMNFPKSYGEFELDRLILNPGGAFPLATVTFVVGVVTCSDKCSLLVEYVESRMKTDVAIAMKDQAMALLFPS